MSMLFFAGAVFGQGLPATGSMAPTGGGGGGGAGSPAYINSVCGPSSSTGNGGASAAVDMTGANFFALVVGYNAANDILIVSDSQGDSPTALTPSVLSGGEPVVNIYYFQNVSGVSGETFSVTGTVSYPGFCVVGFSGMALSGVYETGTQSTANFTQPGASTPSYSGNNVFLTGSSAGTNFSAASIDSGFQSPISITNAPYIYPAAASFFIQNGVTSQNPTWTLTGASGQWSMQAVFKGAN